jgi:sarcosine oxidase subunit alpha
MGRIKKHPILQIEPQPTVEFTYNQQKILAKKGEMISSALYANGIRIFGHHPRDGAPQGLYCANGQCSQCMVIANGKAVKACMTPVSPGMAVQSCNGKPRLPSDDTVPETHPVSTIKTECLIIGGGPAGLSAAIEMAKFGVQAILVDDKYALGGKLTLQTHNFFGSRRDCFAGTRGIDIATLLEKELEPYSGTLIDIWLNSPAVGVFYDKKVGIVKDGTYVLVEPEILLVATGAREKTLAFPGCDLPGVYGAGAFQTLVNRDRVIPTSKLFICGGGNVGLIGGYHALQAGIDVIGLVEALPTCGGYKVHLDKLKRLGVPVYTSHTILRADGKDQLESVTICQIDKQFKPISGTEKQYDVDTLLIAVGLSPVDEMYHKAKVYGMSVFAAGDAQEIAEASAAMFSGRIQGRKIAQALKSSVFVQKEWDKLVATLRSKPGSLQQQVAIHPLPGKVYPIIRCLQEIPCNPCIEACPKGAIEIKAGTLTGQPSFEAGSCLGCAECVVTCPGLAIILVDEGYDKHRKRALLTLPYELDRDMIQAGDEVTTTGLEGERIGTGTVIAYKNADSQDRRGLVMLDVPFEDRHSVASFRLKSPEDRVSEDMYLSEGDEENTIICRCERITKKEIVNLIRAGCRDMNQIKAVLRTGMGACNGKNCTELILRVFREEGVALEEITLPVYRPPDIEVPLGIFAGAKF